MRIVIVGAGAVGSCLADRLSTEGQDVVVVESDPVRAAELQESLDALVLAGNGASPVILREARIAHADLVIVVSNSDGVNALACHTAHRLGVERSVARIEDPDLRAGLEDLGVDVVIDPGERAAHEVLDLVTQRGVFDVIGFADGLLTLVGGITREGSPLIGRTVADIRAGDTESEWASWRPISSSSSPSTPSSSIPTADAVACSPASTPRPWVLEGDPTDPAVLGDLALDRTDVIAALSGWDDVNLTGCLVGKALGAGTAIAAAGVLTILAGGAAWRVVGRRGRITTREGFAAVGLSWVVMSAFGTLPYLLTGSIGSVTDAYFETAAGFTTTGCSVVPDPGALSHGILIWRAGTQWLGGMGVIVLSIAVLPAGCRRRGARPGRVTGPEAGPAHPPVPRDREAPVVGVRGADEPPGAPPDAR